MDIHAWTVKEWNVLKTLAVTTFCKKEKKRIKWPLSAFVIFKNPDQAYKPTMFRCELTVSESKISMVLTQNATTLYVAW